MVALGALTQFGTVAMSHITWRKYKERINRVLESSEDPVEVRNHRDGMFSLVRKERKYSLQVASVGSIEMIYNQVQTR